ncbi:hypothetical protein MLD38_020602 [Melastoma candidum]|uniref:Uncharacterized protein n=1 Tax=Melastoma candidum TaxID=119954 RepID=A0ACB9QEP6_9MYRT|nr:hypothetical protein MLD38_020602 [Melastoma candidum]
MRKLRWTSDGNFWDLDCSTPATIEGSAVPVPGEPLPLGVSRGTRLSRPKQIDFLQRFMAAPFVPTCSGLLTPGLSLQRVLTLPFWENWFVALLGQFNLQKFVSSVRKNGLVKEPNASWLQGIGTHLQDKSLYALNFCSEMLLTPDDTLLVSVEDSLDKRNPRKKAVFRHKFPCHDLLVEAAWPGLFIGRDGAYWEVPSSMSVDLASVASDSGPSYHLSMHRNAGLPKPFETEGSESSMVPASLLPGVAVKGAFAFKKNFNIWRSEGSMLKLVIPNDIFLLNPHISASGIIGAAITTLVGDNSEKSQIERCHRDFQGLHLNAPPIKSALLADTFASVLFSAQHAQDFLYSQTPSLETIQSVCPSATVSLQQQIGGPFSFRVDSRIQVDLKDRPMPVHIDESVFAIEYALQVLGSAKAVAWYSPRNREFMVELRFFEK